MTIMPKYGSGMLYLDGTTSTYVTASQISAYMFGTGQFTVEGWFLFPSTPSNFFSLIGIGMGPYSTTTNEWSLFGSVSQNKLSFDRYDGTTEHEVRISTSVLNLFNGGWHHIAVVRNASDQVACYVDGISQTNTVDQWSSQAINVTGLGTGNNTYIGVTQAGSGTDQFTQTYMDEIGVSAIARYTTNFTPGPCINDGNTALLLHFDGNLTDSSGNANTFSANGDAITSAGSVTQTTNRERYLLVP